MKKNTLILLLLALILALTGCTRQLEDQIAQTAEATGLEAPTRALLDAFLADDPEACLALLAGNVPPEDFAQVYPQLRQALAGMEGYTLRPTGVNTSTTNNQTLTQVVYLMEADGKAAYIRASAFAPELGLAGFNISPYQDVHPTGTVERLADADALQWAALALGALEWALVIWMLVDCLRRQVQHKPAWLLMILAFNPILVLSAGDGGLRFGLHFTLGLQYTALLRYANGLVALNLMVPVGAAVYFFLRKKLRQNAPAPAGLPEAPQA